MIYTIHPSPLGDLLLTGERSADGLLLASVTAPGQRGAREPQDSWTRDDEAFASVTAQLDAYFAGDLKEFDLAFSATAGTAFQREVWAALDALPYGATTTYGELNASLGGSPARARAIGAAIGANPLLIVRPCHRVVGADGSLTGFAAGLPAKELLLTLEGCR
ncbi:methylated-DNA--[protein]-cysteine S-methyltransferase [Actinocorallia longicatena]|uniref:Methylated-DNA--[protein]-cysteine S-methyltransferase n=1 Tax=Actinocorallia longicatena TaxID=111803 RepID=A0ABP6QL67_9ACTN